MKLTEIKNVSELLKNDRVVKIIVLIGMAVIVMILFFDLFEFGNLAVKSENSVDAAKYAAELEKRVTDIVSEINGAGRVKVMITLENLDENVYSQKETSVTTVKTPKVRGAAIVCEGGDNILVKEKIIETVSKVLGISTARVSVTN